MESTGEKIAQRYLKASFQLEAMSNLRSKSTGVIGAVIWISVGESDGKSLRHGPRIKVALGDKLTTDGLKNAVSVTISKSPRVLGQLPSDIEHQVLRFVRLNYNALKLHWEGQLDTTEVLSALKKV